MAKYKMYTLYAKIEGHKSSRYTLEEALKEESKRPQSLMTGSLIEELDKLTARYESYLDLLESYPEEVFGQPLILYDPVIIVDKDIEDKSKSYPIFDIVFKEDQRELENRDNIRNWLLDFLLNNPERVTDFRGIKDIYENVEKKYKEKSIEYLIRITILTYLEDNNYKRYREAYFTLKKLDYKNTKKDEVHR